MLTLTVFASGLLVIASMQRSPSRPRRRRSRRKRPMTSLLLHRSEESMPPNILALIEPKFRCPPAPPDA